MSGFVHGFVSKVTGSGGDQDQQQQQQQQNQNQPGQVIDEADNSGSGFGKVTGVLSSVAGSVGDKVTSVAPDALLEWKNEKEKMILDFKQEKENMIKSIVVGKIDGIYNLATNTIGDVIKKKMKDPYMPEFVQDLVDELVDTFWPDVTSEAKERILSGMAPKIIIDHGQKPCFCGGHILSFFRYYLKPYDRSFWRQIRNPLYILFVLLSLVPTYGIGLMTYMLFLLLQDCSDSFAMQAYIVDFKALQFIGLGTVSAIVGSVQYYICLSSTPHTCETTAPKIELWIMLLFVAQVFFVWAAFCFLRSGQRKGGYKFQYDQATKKKLAEQAANSNQMFNAIATNDQNFTQKMFVDLQAESDEDMSAKSVRRLMRFLIWDIIVFIICVIMVCFIFFFNKLDEDAQADFGDTDSFQNWKLSMSLFWVKAFYGLMAFPFALLKLPVINTVISHAKPTGFNWWGNTVPYTGKEEDKCDVPWEPEYKHKI